MTIHLNLDSVYYNTFKINHVCYGCNENINLFINLKYATHSVPRASPNIRYLMLKNRY